MKKGILKKIIDRIILEFKCWKADSEYYIKKALVIDSCFSLKQYPPSFFIRHTKEEAEAIIKREREAELAKLKSMLDEFEKRIEDKESGKA